MPEEKSYHVNFGSRRISFELAFSNRKTLGIKVHPDCIVQVIAPNGADIDRVYAKVKEKAPWIQKQLNEFLSYHPRTTPRKYVDGETHLYLGRQYRLKIVNTKDSGVKLIKGRIVVSSPRNAVKEVLQRWFRNRAEEYFSDVLQKHISLFAEYKIVQPVLRIRKMRNRWGSCTDTGLIALNPELIKAPKACIDYVVIHELCHLVHHNHTRRFYMLQQQMMPDWEKAKRRLEMALA